MTAKRNCRLGESSDRIESPVHLRHKVHSKLRVMVYQQYQVGCNVITPGVTAR